MASAVTPLIKAREELSDIRNWSPRGLYGPKGERCIMGTIHHFYEDWDKPVFTPITLAWDAMWRLHGSDSDLISLNDGKGKYSEIPDPDRHKMLLQVLDIAIEMAKEQEAKEIQKSE